jgi:hypothetical protein
MCIFCISKKIGRSVRLLHCYMSGGMSALVVCFACLSASFFLLLSVSCSRTWRALLFLFCAFFQNSISALAGVLLSLCYLCYLMLSLCYLCYLRWGTVLWSVLSLCYLCAIYAISCSGELFALCYLCAIYAISVLSLCYLSDISWIFLSNLWPLHRLMQKMLPTLKDMHPSLVWQVSVVTEDLLTLLS